MRTYTKVCHEGELLGPVDWSYDFNQHNGILCCSDIRKAEITFKRVQMFWNLEREFRKGKQLRVCDDSGFWHDLFDMGMYDGWPFWKPTPAYFHSTPIGVGEWGFFYQVQGFEEREGA